METSTKKQQFQFEVSIKIRARSGSIALRKLHRKLGALGPNRLSSKRAEFQYWNNGVV